MKHKLKQLYPVIFITIVVFISISLLSLTDSLTSEKREQQADEAVLSMLRSMFPGMSGYTLENEVYIINDNENIIGYACIASGNGYGGNIDILVGLEDAETIKGIEIISHSETPGLGARITEDDYRQQYSGLSINDIELKINGGKIDAITGATISSRAVVDAVRTTALEKVREIFGGGGGRNE